MSRLARFFSLVVVFGISACSSVEGASNDSSIAASAVGHFGYGEIATAEMIAGWDIDIRPDGLGLPAGGASAEDGEMLYEDMCASCHGSFGEGVGRYPVLAGGEGTLADARPEKTVGSFWPYASTLWDYIHRAMPFTEPESLSDNEVYAITAYVLYLNDLLEYDFVLTRDNLALVEMPNKDGFFLDNRPDVVADRCMKNCKDPKSIEITSEPVAAEPQAAVGDVAPTNELATGQATYDQACALCHASGVGDAPILGDRDGWANRSSQGRDVMVANALAGKGTMPPKGGQTQLTDEDVASAVDFMLMQVVE